jgi:hypothetical protein
MSTLDRARDFLRLRREEEDVHDFLGVVMIDPRYNVIVMPDHVAAVLRVSGTDFLYSQSVRDRVLDAWRDMLNKGGISVQAFVDRRPIKWDLEGGHLDQIKVQVDAYSTDPESWEQGQLARYREALLNAELESGQRLAVSELAQYVVIRLAMGAAELLIGDDERPMYLPPARSWRFWEQIPVMFRGRRGRDLWKRQAEAASRALVEEVRRFMALASEVPGFSIERCDALEITQLIHVLWKEDAAYEPGVWVRDRTMLRNIIRGTTEAEA